MHALLELENTKRQLKTLDEDEHKLKDMKKGEFNGVLDISAYLLEPPNATEL